jgi:hypothetical protein
VIDAFLLLEQPRQRLGHWSHALAALDTHHAPPLAEVTAYYDPDGDIALLALRYDELALGESGLAYVVEVALLAEIGMIQPGELSAGDRKRFLGERLARCTIEAVGQRTAVAALGDLVRKLRGKPAKATSAQIVDALPQRQSSPRLPAVPPPIPVRSKSTRDDLPQIVPAVFEDDPVPMPRSTRDIPKPMRAGSPRPEDVAEPYVPPPTPNTPDMIYARYLRSGRWVPIRIGSLSLRGAALLAGALPRMQDFVDVALSFGGHRALVRGCVAKVSTMTEASTTGAATFSVEFSLDDAARRQLTALLTAARAAKVTIKPPPPRATRRFPVEWPVCLGTVRGAIRGDALDVSRGGMFVKPAQPMQTGTTLNFSALLDDGAGPVAGRARVVRHITDAEALACGLVAGYGLRILDMGDADQPRWNSFLARVEKRADRRVLIGASPARLAELQATLAAAGYAVTGGTDPGALVQLASTDARPVDAAMIDGSWLGDDAGSAAWFETLFSARNVPCLTLHGDAKRARASIDQALEIWS